jgi:hypothetical protein
VISKIISLIMSILKKVKKISQIVHYITNLLDQ